MIFRFYDYICSGEAQISFLQIDSTSPYQVRLITKLTSWPGSLLFKHRGGPLLRISQGELFATCKASGLEKLACGKSLWVFGVQDRQAHVNLSINDSPASWWPSAGFPSSSQPFLSLSYPGAVNQPSLWGLLAVIADISLASLLASVPSMERGSVREIKCDDA